MLEPLAKNIWHLQHEFIASGLRVSSRMTVVRLGDSSLWLHSPVPIPPAIKHQLEALGQVRYIVAPSKTHHLFLADCLATFPQADLFGPPGLSQKRPDLPAIRELNPAGEPEWKDDLEQVLFEGIPYGNEFVWLHKSSHTLILTDLCQWWRGSLPTATRVFARLTGVRSRPAVPRTVRWLVKDKQAAKSSAERILQWRIDRIILGHNTVIEHDAKQALSEAFKAFM